MQHLTQAIMSLCILCTIAIKITGKTIYIGTTNQKWKDTLNNAYIQSFKDPSINLNIAVLSLPSDDDQNAPITFRQKIANVRENLNTYKKTNNISHFNVILGDADPAVQSALDEETLPFFVPITTNIYFPSTLCLSPHEGEYAAVVERMLKINKVEKAVVIIDSEKDYDSFFLPLLESQQVFIRIWKAEYSNGTNVRKTLMSLRDSKFETFIIRGSLELTKAIMLEARYLAIITMPYRWIFASEKCPNFNLKTYTELKTNFTFISDICATDIYKNEKTDVSTEEDLLSYQVLSILKSVGWNTELALLKAALKDGVKYTLGDTSSTILLSEDMHRDRLNLNIHTLNVTGLQKIGRWNSKNAELLFETKLHGENDTSHKQKVYRVAAVEEHPHLIIDASKEIGQGRFRGYGVDLMTELTKRMDNATFEIEIFDEHGEKNEETGKWNGVIGALLNGTADMSLGALVQDREREDVIDFSTLFMNFEIILVMVKKREGSGGLDMSMIFQFLSPFHRYVWICIIAAIALLSFALWVIEAASERITKAETEFNLQETSWFIFATTIQGGTELIPRSFAGRILTGTLYFFTLIMISSYTANLAAFLTVQKLDNPINDVKDLANPKNKERISYGTVKDSAVLEFFEHATDPDLKIIYRTLTQTNPDWLVDKIEDGFNRSRFGYKGKDYIFIWDYKVAMYEVLQESKTCDLDLIGKPFGKRAIAVGIQQGSLLKEKIDSTLLQMQKENVMETLENKWWTAAAVCSATPDDSQSSSEELTLVEMAGVFVVLLGGLIISFIFLCLQYLATKMFKKLKKKVEKSSTLNKFTNSRKYKDCDEIKNQETFLLSEKERNNSQEPSGHIQQNAV